MLHRVSLAFTILGLLGLIYIYADLAEKMETRKWENIIQTEPGTFHVTKMKDTNTRQKDKHEGKRRYHENVSFSLRISVYSWVSHTVNTQRVLFPESLRNKEECKKTIVTRRIQTIELLQQEITEKKAMNAGSKHYHTCKKSRRRTLETMNVYGQSAFHETRSHFS